jgi:hypothetical protein
MKIRLDDPSSLEDLRDFLRRAGCLADPVGPDTLEVTVPRAPSPEQERRELEIYLAVWRARFPDAGADLVAD